MFSANFFAYAALATAIGALAGIVIEIAVKDPSLFGKILRDSEALAAPAPRRTLRMIGGEASAADPANSNEARKAAA